MGRGRGPPRARGPPTLRFEAGDGRGPPTVPDVRLVVELSGPEGLSEGVVGCGLGPFTVADERLVVELEGVGTAGSDRPSRLGRSRVSRLGRSKRSTLALSKLVRGLTSGYRSDMRSLSVEPFGE